MWHTYFWSIKGGEEGGGEGKKGVLPAVTQSNSNYAIFWFPDKLDPYIDVFSFFHVHKRVT